MFSAATPDRTQDGPVDPPHGFEIEMLMCVHVVLTLDCTKLSQWLAKKRTDFAVERDGASTASVAADTEEEDMSGATSDQVWKFLLLMWSTLAMLLFFPLST